METGFQHRFYRKWAVAQSMAAFTVRVDETDLAIKASVPLRNEARELVREYRSSLLEYARRHPRLLTSFKPLAVEDDAPEIVKLMASASAQYDVGPMAAVAGAIAELTGRRLLEMIPQSEPRELIIENGGDCFIKTDRPATVLLFAGERSPFNAKLKIKIDAAATPKGVCTSSATVGHSKSFGSADAVVAVADSAALADAAATAICNGIHEAADIRRAIEAEKKAATLAGLLITLREHIGTWGIEIEPAGAGHRPRP